MRRAICCVVVLAAIGSGQNWETSPILAAPGSSMATAIATDSVCLPHVAFGLSSPGVLGYASKTGDSWRIEHIDSGTVVSDVCLCLDSEGLPHVGYHGHGGIRYAWWDGINWHTEAVASGSGLSLVLGQDRAPHILFVDSLQAVEYAWKAGDTWNILDVPARQPDSLRRFQGASLALDTCNRPGIAVTWWKSGQRDSLWLSFFEYDGHNWHRFDVDSAEGWAPYDFLAAPRVQNDPSTGLFHVVYRFGAYATGEGGNWLVEAASNVPACNSLCEFDLHCGRPHIASANPWQGALYYQWRWAGGWGTEPVTGGITTALSIAADRTGRPHIAFCRYGGTLFYARRMFIGTEEPVPQVAHPKLRLAVCPNPAFGNLTVQYGVPVKGRVKLVLYDAQGRVKAVIRDEETSPGYYRQNVGRRALSLPAGVYFLALAQDGNQVTRKVVLAE